MTANKYIVTTIIAMTLLSCSNRQQDKEPAIGMEAPVFQAVTLGEEAFRLEQLRGRYVLLDFWGSWCAPCRKEHPELIELYRDFSDHDFTSAAGFEIVSVGIETDSLAWRKAIRQDGLPWPYQIMEQTVRFNKVETPIAGRYGVEQVPSRFLIDEKGRIVGINPGPEAVRTYLRAKK